MWLATRSIGPKTVDRRIDEADVRWRAVARTLDLLLPGLFAWGVTVAWPVLGRPSASLAKGMALVALAALVSGSVLASRWPALARALGVWSFLALCTGVWASAKSPAGAFLLDPVQGIAGSLGWALFAVGWAGDGGAQRMGSDTNAKPRSRLWRGAAWVVAFATAAAALLLALAWWVPGRARALFAHAAAVAGAVALVGAAAEIAVRKQPQTQRSESSGGGERDTASQDGSWRARLDGAKTTLIALATLALLGAAYAATR